MIQRVLIAACLLMTMASLAHVGLVWHRSNQAMIAMVDVTRRLAEVQAANQAKTIELLSQLQASGAERHERSQPTAQAVQSTQAPQAPRASERVPVTLKLTLGKLGGPAAVGYQATLWRGLSINRESDAGGLVDFGLAYPGDCQFELSRTIDETHNWRCRGNLNVVAGDSFLKEIVCPDPAAVRAPVKLRVEWPADLAAKDLRIVIALAQPSTTLQPLLTWQVVDASAPDAVRTLVSGPGPKQTEIIGSTKLSLWHDSGSSKSSGFERVFADLQSASAASATEAIALESGRFLLRRLIVLQPRPRRNTTIPCERFAVLAYTVANNEELGDVYVSDGDPSDGFRLFGSGSAPLSSFKGGVTVASSYWRQVEGRLSVHPGQVNEWTLPLPAKLINVVRQQLEAKDNLKPKDPGALGARRGPEIQLGRE